MPGPGRAQEFESGSTRSHGAIWRPLVGVPLLTVALSVLALLLPMRFPLFIVGALVASGVWISVLLVLLCSGTASLVMGDVGEQRTAQELRPFCRSGWKLINRMLIRPRSDVDHVALGPGGVIVVETKWSATTWALDAADDRLAKAVQQARDNAHDVRIELGPMFRDAPVYPVVVLWSPERSAGGPITVDGVLGMDGSSLRSWMASVPQNSLSGEQVQHGWSRLENLLSRREDYDLKRDGPSPRSVTEVAWQCASVPLAAFAGLSVSTALVQWLGGAGVALSASALFAIGWRGLRFSRTRWAALGWIGGTQFVTVAFLAALAFDWLR